MRRTMTWWRNLSGLMAACVLALLVVAPTVGMAACVCEDGAPVVGVETAVVQAVQGDQRDHNAPCEAACCVGGHCHHGGAMLDAAVADVAALPPAASGHATAAVHVLASRVLSGLDRPPRA
ncbi:hypothetical protein [Caulobacter sp. UNC358MFTsu5.1]|uniref:hypothetical protein n=1 Tax=Caulobacter sp. UNC358MFTsu5.1 TaxID=1449049 RepID=UPI0009DCDF6D|nr:hypothetical protein [Caulobacter sp. UNC358MFTsu5.1]